MHIYFLPVLPYSELRKSKRSCLGFTLIELLVAVALIGILVGVALPQYSAYRQRAFDTRARMDLRSAAIAEEAYFIDNERYMSCKNQSCTNLPGVAALSKGTLISLTGTASGFAGTSSHPQGTGQIFSWDSENGGFEE